MFFKRKILIFRSPKIDQFRKSHEPIDVRQKLPIQINYFGLVIIAYVQSMRNVIYINRKII